MNTVPVISGYLVALVAMSGSLLPSQADAVWPFGPNSAEECRDEYVRDGKTDLAVRLIARACTELFGDNDREEWADCVLEHVGDTGSETAIKLIAKSCSNKAKNGASKRDKCLLKKLPGTDSELAAKRTAYSCNS